MSETPTETIHYEYKNIGFRIEIYCLNQDEYYGKWFCLKCNDFHETNNYTDEDEAKQACKRQANNHANLHQDLS